MDKIPYTQYRTYGALGFMVKPEEHQEAVQCAIKDCAMTKVGDGCVYCKYTVGEDAEIQVASWGGETVAQMIEPVVPTKTVMLSAHTGKVLGKLIASSITDT